MLAKAARVHRAAHYGVIFAGGSPVHGLHLTVRTRPTSDHSRFGFIVGMRVSRKATVRNLIKRRLRAAARELYGRISSASDIVVIAKPGADRLSYEELAGELTMLLRRAKVLP